MSKEIILYPGNWLYNAGVIGFLNTIDKEYFILNNGTVEIDKSIFNNLDIEKNYFDINKIINLKGKNNTYPNYIDARGAQISFFVEFINNFKDLRNDGYCDICHNAYNLEPTRIDELKEKFPKTSTQFLEKIDNFNIVFNKLIGPSVGEFPNGFWNMNQTMKICHLCSFIMIHRHISFKILSDSSSVFINTPSFEQMYNLNNIVGRIFESKNINEGKFKRDILAMSIIEYSNKLNCNLGMWNSMNIEIITEKKNSIDYYTMPSDLIKLISDRKIASILSNLGEYRILNIVLNKNYSLLINIGAELLKLSFIGSANFNKNNKDYLNATLFRDENKNNLNITANKIFKLFSLIEEKIKENK